MWYLIVPPIIVIVSIVFVLWYLSRKSVDPSVAALMSQMEAQPEQKISFIRTKTFALRFLEKMVCRFKVTALRMYNTLHQITQSLKEKQRRFQVKETREIVPTPSVSSIRQFTPLVKRWASLRSGKRQFFGMEETKNISTTIDQETISVVSSEKMVLAENTILETPIVRNRHHLSATRGESVPKPQEKVFSEKGSFVKSSKHSDTVPSESVRVDKTREEGYIARIAVHPKDFVAYEGLGDYYLEIGNIKDAKECYRQVLKLSPVQRMVKIKIRRLEKILTKNME